MHRHLIAAHQDAYCVIMISDPEQHKRSYAPGFANSFRIPLIGVITKVDTVSKERQEACEEELTSAGIKLPFHYISLREGTGIDKLIKQVRVYQQSMVLRNKLPFCGLNKFRTTKGQPFTNILLIPNH